MRLLRLRPVLIGSGFLVSLLALWIGQGLLQRAAAQAQETVQAPRFEVDPFWPKPLPNHWLLGSSIGVAVDARDHVWIIHRGAATMDKRTEMTAVGNPPTSEVCCSPAPAVLEFDPSGNLVGHWGGPGQGYDWPQSNHGITVDHKDNVWIGGNGETDAHVLKFTRDGKFLLQMGRSGANAGSNDTTNFGRVAKIFVDARANEAYLADGYLNKRVAVLDADSGKLKRYWGAYGKKPDDTPLGNYNPDAPPPPQFRNPVHCVELAHDGLLYVCDRANNRIQVFRADGTFVREAFIAKRTLGSGSVWDLAFSKDPDQRFMYLADGVNERVYVIQRSTLEVLTSFGDGGRQPGQFFGVHSIAVDSKGNIYTTETYEGKRLQKFVFKGLAPVTRKDQGVVWPTSPSAAQRPAARDGAPTLYEGARLIDGTGSAPIESSAFIVERGTITTVGKKGEITAARGSTRVDLTGKTVMPTLISVHGHPGFQKGLTYTRENYTRETYMDDLHRAAYFGVRAVVSQGIDPGELALEIRRDQQSGAAGGARLFTAGRGIGAPNAGPGADAFKGVAYEVTTEEEARSAVREQAANGVDLIKVWVDDRGGRAPRLAPPLYRAVIDEAHARGLVVNAHVFYHSDGEALAGAGVDAFAHLVRDREMDDALVAALVRRNVYVMPNLGPQERSAHISTPPWFRERSLSGLLRDTVPRPVIQRMTKSFTGRDPAAVEAARGRYDILQRSLAKLSRAGARVVLGPDTGLPDHFFGYAEQRELEAMAGAGMTPVQIIVAATSRGAEYLKQPRMGSLAPGKNADFIVLDANPLDDIRNSRRIARVYFDGVEVDRAALRARFTQGKTH